MSNDIIFIGSSFDKKIVSYHCLNIIMTPVIVNKQTLIMPQKQQWEGLFQDFYNRQILL